MPITSRQKILDYLKRNRTASSREVARVLRMTPANARRHLGILAADGRVEVVSQRGAGRGRPGKVYRLSGALAGDNLSALAEALLTEAGASVGMEALGRRLAGEAIPSYLPLMRRLAAAVERLNGMHYQARWEAGAQGPRVILGQCPYAALVGKHPELCGMDAALLGSLLGGEALQAAKMEPGGTQPCVFLLGRP
ncbi:MAG: helix-turn-helix transcriptional regulator [Chloroflexota bacterium]